MAPCRDMAALPDKCAQRLSGKFQQFQQVSYYCLGRFASVVNFLRPAEFLQAPSGKKIRSPFRRHTEGPVKIRRILLRIIPRRRGSLGWPWKSAAMGLLEFCGECGLGVVIFHHHSCWRKILQWTHALCWKALTAHG